MACDGGGGNWGLVEFCGGGGVNRGLVECTVGRCDFCGGK